MGPCGGGRSSGRKSSRPPPYNESGRSAAPFLAGPSHDASPGVPRGHPPPPDENAPRLIYADWLDDQGDAPRAEFIRLQCRLDGLSADERPTELVSREKALLSEHGNRWAEPLRPLVESWTFRRGFVGDVWLSAHQLQRHGTDLFRLVPLQSVHVTASGTDVGDLAESPHLARVTGLEVRGSSLGDDGMRTLLGAPALFGRLETLILHHCSLTQQAALILAAAGPSALRLLNLGANDLRDEGMALLCDLPALAGLEVLGLGGNELRPASATALAHSSYLHALRKINLGANYLDDDAISALAAAPHLASLAELDVRYNEFGLPGARALAESPHLAGLLSLDVKENRIGDEGLALLHERFGDRVRY
jgi:uncharacterized protein (TIGR02996 family)